jgi:hypothetical protein
MVVFFLLLEFFFALFSIIKVDKWSKFVVVNIMEPESLSVSYTQVINISHLLEVLHEVKEFFIVYILHETSDRYAVVKLLSERIGGVIYQKNIFQVNVLEDAQIFDEDTSFWNLNAGVSVVPMLDELTCGVYPVNYGVSVDLGASSEDCYFIVLIC